MEDGSDTPPPTRSRPRRRAAAVVAVMIVAALVALWSERRPIAGHFVDREFARRGVPARYAIADLGLGRQRLTNVVIGDPAHPDLVADWIETRIGYGLSGAALDGIAAGHVRIRGRWVDGRVSLGALDKLLPPPSGGPVAFPALRADLADVRLRLETPWGIVGARLSGVGRLDRGFAGRLAIASDRLAGSGCAATGVRAAWTVRTTGVDGADGQGVRADGPLRAAALRCRGLSFAGWRSDLKSRLALGTPRRSAIDLRLATGAIRHAEASAAAASGTIGFDGRSERGTVDLAAADVAALEGGARRLRVVGDLREGATFDGRIEAMGIDATRYVPTMAGRAAGTPIGPLVDRLDVALAAAAKDGAASAAIVASLRPAPAVRLSLVRWRSASGAAATIAARGDEPALRWRADDGVAAAAIVAVEGGGLPRARVSLAKPAGKPWRGVATLDPYRVGSAEFAATPIAFAAGDDGAVRVQTNVTLSGPLGDGRVEALRAAIDLRRSAGGALLLDPACAPVGWRRLVVGPLDLAPARLTLCPIGDALVTMRGGKAGGGARTAASDLAGRIGGSPLVLKTGAASLALGGDGFRIADVAAVIGQPGRTTRLSVASLTGTLTPAVGGRFSGGGGQIGAVPLLLSAAQGTWSVARGALRLDGMLAVSDVAGSPRFKPLLARDVVLTLADGRIAATGALTEPNTGTRVVDVRLAHALASGTGSADLVVPRLSFGKAFQPDLLTPLTFGVVADVHGDVSGAGRIDWNPAGVRSTGRFGTEALDLAAAFGPVSGIATTIRFDDLLAMHTPPGQVASVRSVNPGIAVENGVVRYQLVAPTQIRVEGARWPFAGGALTLEPTLLDFSQDRERRMTFRVDGAAADQFLQQFDFDNVQATGVFDGVLPMVFDQAGGRIVGGDLKVRTGGGTLAYVGALSQEQLGFWGNLAFQALKSLRYRSLAVQLNGPLAGEMITDVRFAGVSQGQGAKANFLVRRLQRLPFVFNIRIKAPFRGLLDSAQSFYDPKRLIQRNLPALLRQQSQATAPTPPPVQPPASGPVR